MNIEQVRKLLIAAIEISGHPLGRRLTAQVPHITQLSEVAPRSWDFELQGASRVDLPDGPIQPVVTYSTTEMPDGGEVLIWVRNGQLDALELPWFTSVMPEIPTEQDLRL